MKTPTFKLTKGQVYTTDAQLNIVPGEGNHTSGTYLWIGDDDNGCYGTISGVKTLEKLAMGILRHLGHKVTLR